MTTLRQRLTTTLYGNQRLPIHPAVYMFLYITAACGFFFLFLGGTAAVHASLLWQATTVLLGHNVINLWGLLATLTTILNVYGWTMRKPRAHNTAAIMGFMLWLFACLMYVTGSYWFHLTVLGLPNLAFWTFYYIATLKRTRQAKIGR